VKTFVRPRIGSHTFSAKAFYDQPLWTCRMEEEHRQATRALLARRSQRMKELYAAEAAQLTRELQETGLCMSKEL